MADERLEGLELEKVAEAFQAVSEPGRICYDLGSKDPPPDSMRDRRLYNKPAKPLELWTREDMFHH